MKKSSSHVKIQQLQPHSKEQSATMYAENKETYKDELNEDSEEEQNKMTKT